MARSFLHGRPRPDATSLLLGDPAPNFVAQTTEGEIEFHRWKGHSWAVLFSHPGGFTPVCATELGTLARLEPEFERRETKLIGLSIDPVLAHRHRAAEIEATEGVRLGFPLIGDSSESVATRYGLVRPGADAALTVRGVFVIDPANIVRLTLAYPPQTGHSFTEILRALDALRLSDRHGVCTPADWIPGERVLVSPAIDDETAHERFGGFETERPHLRWVDPSPAHGAVQTP